MRLRQIQFIKHIVEECPQTRYKGGIERLHKGDDEAMDWLSKTNVRLEIYYELFLLLLSFLFFILCLFNFAFHQ
ncbi:Uncharacterized protein FWK35_00026238 [Aphis craccivora]|uniref:Uncharacterized protein n=1 Tax=Aphis craccivora TaxID=307492 RepID=A0A6G0VXH8_APHCR|nr:Uncharacterized protein FWK35_00026238 [Aphis craccivora]